MTKREVLGLLKDIAEVFPNFEITQKIIDIWAATLVKLDAQVVQKNFVDYLAKSPYPPKPSDLIKPLLVEKMVTPDVSETKQMFSAWDKKEVATKEVREQHLQQIARMLGIKRSAS